VRDGRDEELERLPMLRRIVELEVSRQPMAQRQAPAPPRRSTRAAQHGHRATR